ncbi:MAG: GntR family transcriptional regulator, partial [Alphaproteobacteria bacterium]|nr:GntR family transcriptional regulator [Alphaproteobacteria bacterium]
EARHVFEARHALERVLVERAIEAGSDRDIASLVETARQEKKAAEKGDKEERVKLSGAFHLQLARIGGNPVLTGFLTELVSRTSLIIALYESPGAVPCSHSEHLEIATAIRQRNRARAVQYMNHHLQHIEAQLDLSNALVNVDFAHLFKTSAPRRAAKAPT